MSQQTIEDLEEKVDPTAPYNVGERKHVRAKERANKSATKDLDDVMDALLQMQNGRRWLAWLLNDVCGVDNPLVPGAYASDVLHWREGARTCGIAIREQAIAVNRANYLKLLDEHLPKRTK